MMENILLAFIPLFVAVNAIGVLPIFVSLTEGFDKKVKVRIVFQSMVTAVCLAIGFVFLGKAVFQFLGITVGDFMVAGGAILFCIAITDIVIPGQRQRIPAKELAAVPLGTPLITGPAVLTTSLIIIEQYGLYAALISVCLNILLAGLIFWGSDVVIRTLGEAGAKALSKVTSLLLAAIAVMMARKGLAQLLNI